MAYRKHRILNSFMLIPKQYMKACKQRNKLIEHTFSATQLQLKALTQLLKGV